MTYDEFKLFARLMSKTCSVTIINDEVGYRKSLKNESTIGIVVAKRI